MRLWFRLRQAGRANQLSCSGVTGCAPLPSCPVVGGLLNWLQWGRLCYIKGVQPAETKGADSYGRSLKLFKQFLRYIAKGSLLVLHRVAKWVLFIKLMS